MFNAGEKQIFDLSTKNLHFFSKFCRFLGQNHFKISTSELFLKLFSKRNFTKSQLVPLSSISRHSNETTKSLLNQFLDQF